MTSAASSTIVASSLALALASPALARADDASRADALFREGRALLDAKRFDEACPKLAESQRLEPGAGTLLALSLCHEGQGKNATAQRDLRDASALGRRVGRNALAIAADKRATALEPSLAHLVIRMPDGASGYDVRCDGERAEALDRPFAVDPGEHRVDVSAKGKRSRSYVVRLGGAGSVEILIEPLDDAPVAAAAASGASTAPAPAPGLRVVPLSEPPPAADEGRGGAQRVVGGSLIALGVVGLGAGAYFGGRALSENADAKDASDSTGHDRARASMNASIVSIAGGTGAIMAGALVYVLAPRSAASATRASARVVPDAGPTHAGLGVLGTF